MQESRGPRPYDVATRQLIDRDPAAWLIWAGLTVDGPVQALDSEVSTVLAEVDKVLQVDAPAPWLAHLEIQASHDQQLPLRLLEYHALLLHRHKLPVASIVVLLRSQADGSELDGELHCPDPMGDVSLSFQYRVIRVWQRPVEEFLTGGLGILPLAPLAAVQRAEMPAIVERMAARLDREASPDVARNLWTATLLLLGLRYDERTAHEVVRNMSWLQESSTYQAILEQGREVGREQGREEGREEGRAQGQEIGRAVEARRMLLRQGEHRFGSPPASVVAAIESISDIDRLEQLSLKLLTATGWDELLDGEPTP